MEQGNQHLAVSVRGGAVARRALTYAAMAALPFFVLATSAVRADSPREVFNSLEYQGFGVQECVSAFEGTDGDVSATGRCAIDSLFTGLLGATLELANRQGRALFGEQFHIDNRMDLAPSRGGLAGSLDAVIPLHAFSSATENSGTRAFFLQNGLTRWTDSHGLDRTDIRYGLVNRYAMPGWLGSGVLGASVFFQENLERGHQRVVTGFDYASRLGSSSLTYFMPTTGWRPGRPGYDEHALEGVEYAFRRDATSTISMNAAAGRWKTDPGLEEWDTRGRVGVDWKPHPWFAIGGSWDDIGTVDDFLQLRATVGIAFGGGDKARARWEGLGRTGAGSDDEDSSLAGDVWRSVTDIGQINFAEQQTPSPEVPTPDPDAETNASSGMGILLQVVKKSNGSAQS